MVEELCLRLLLEWLQDSYGVAFAAEGSPQAGWAEARSGPHSMRLHIGALWEEDEPWSRSRRALEEETGRGLDGAWILWVPPGAALPAQGPAAADFVRRVRDVASALAPGRRSYVPLPALLYLVKTDEAGGYVSAEGGLSPYWAHLSERVQGTYFLDSRSLHRLPEGDKARDELLRTIVELAAELPLNRLT
ncbi:MAG TPA: hypothetical protein VJM69_06430, partial [Dehalococcoidia bacterium]|nr:hypothetical protein [Dehalococcoidia bacterium]